MTLQTAGKSLQHVRGMRHSMTGLALGPNTMHRTVTEDTGQLSMLGIPGLEGLPDLIVTGPAEAVGHIGPISNLRGLVGLVTAHTILKGLALKVWIVTVETVGDVAVPGMAEVTGLFGMCARHTGHLLPGTGMTGKTGLFVFTSFKGDLKRGMRVGMALETVLKGEMTFPLVTPGTLRNHLLSGKERGMPFMTFKTPHPGVLAPFFIDLFNLRRMTLHTVRVCKDRRGRGRCISHGPLSPYSVYNRSEPNQTQ